ncbi:MAG: Imm8 family immunity protein [Myxococcota bacterium]
MTKRLRVSAIYVGPRGEDGNNHFDVMIVSKAALKKYEPSTTNPERGYFIIDDFDWGVVRRYVEDCVKKSDTGEWDSSIQNLREFFFWEYDNFQRA